MLQGLTQKLRHLSSLKHFDGCIITAHDLQHALQLHPFVRLAQLIEPQPSKTMSFIINNALNTYISRVLRCILLSAR